MQQGGRVSNPVSYFMAGVLPSSSGVIFNNDHPTSVFVCTFVSLINRTDNQGDVATMYVNPSGTNFHSGSVGSGQSDRFPLQLELAVAPSSEIVVQVLAGAWDAVVTGHWEVIYA